MRSASTMIAGGGGGVNDTWRGGCMIAGMAGGGGCMIPGEVLFLNSAISFPVIAIHGAVSLFQTIY
jgi:hypothetical protein